MAAVSRRRRRSSQKPFWKNAYTWIGVFSLFILGGCVWYVVSTFFMDEQKTGTDEKMPVSSQQTSKQKTSQLQLPTKDDRALLQLIEPVEVNNKGDRYQVSNAEEVQLVVTAKKPTQISVEFGSGKKTSKNLQAGEEQTFTDAKSISIDVTAPNQVQISVNGNIVDTTNQTEKAFYQFLLENDE